MTYNNINDAMTMGNEPTMRPGGGNSLGRIDKYELVRELGEGGFGTVYLARDTVANVDVAIKGLPPEVKHNSVELESIRGNFALVKRLRHPNIVAVTDLHLAQSVRYLSKDAEEKLRVFPRDTMVVMDYAPGVTLAQWRRQFPGGKVPLDKAIAVVRQVASALDYAHGQKVLHRDVKPANVMIEESSDGRLAARVLDFGLAAEIRSSMGRLSREIRDTSGTRPYMAPEQWIGGRQGPATDQYSLAVLFYELVVGEVPFSSVFDCGDTAVMRLAVTTDAPEIPPSLPRNVRRALVIALAKKPEERFASCGDFVAALEGEKVSRGGAGTRSAGVGRLLAAAALIAAIAAGGWWWMKEGTKGTDRTDGTNGSSVASVPAVVSVPEPKPIAEPAPDDSAEEWAKTEAINIRIEAKVEQGKVARISDADGFDKCKDALADVFARAEAYFEDKVKRWSEAAQGFSNYVSQCAVLRKLDVDRRSAVSARDRAAEAKRKAESVDAKEYAEARWREADKLMGKGGDEFGQMRFAESSTSFALAAEQFVKSESEAKAERTRRYDEARKERERLAKEKREREEREAREREAPEVERKSKVEAEAKLAKAKFEMIAAQGESKSDAPKSSTPCGFTDNLDEALAKAKAEGKLVYACFSGSDWCGWCMKLEREVLSRPEFLAGVKDDFVLVFIDSPKDKTVLSGHAKTANPKMVKEYGIKGFPTALILDGDGKQIGETGYRKGGPIEYAKHLMYFREVYKGLGKAKRVEAESCQCAPMVRAATPIAYGGDNPWQLKRHEEKMKLVSAGGAKVVFIGDSITHFWETTGRKYFSTDEYRMLNLGFAGDRTENVLWRIDNGELDGYNAKCVVLLIGTNNTGHFPIEKESSDDTILGIKTILERIREKQPTAIIVVIAIFPRGASPEEPLRQRNDLVNRGIQRFCDGKTVLWCDFGKSLLDEKGDTKWVMPDRLHLNAKGFEIWYENVKPYIDYALYGGPPPVNADDIVAGVTESAVIMADSCLDKKLIVKDSGTTYLRNAIMPFVHNGSLPGAIGVLYKSGQQETACMGWADMGKRIPMSMDRTFMIGSQSKGFCGVCIAMLVEGGMINLDDPISRYFPQFANMIVEVKDGNTIKSRTAAKNEITIRHLLTHCAGFPFDVPSVLEKGWTSCPISQVVAEAAANPLVAEPGTKIQYSNIGFAIAAAIIEKLSGQRYEEFLEKRIFNPLGMRDTTFNPTDEQLYRRVSMYTLSQNAVPVYAPENKWMPLPHNGPTVYAHPAMGLWSTADDLIKFYQMIMSKGVGANGVRLLQEQTVLELLATSQRPSNLNSTQGYSLGFQILKDEPGWLGHGGAWGTYFKVNIDKQELFLWVVQLCGGPRPWDAHRQESAELFFKNVSSVKDNDLTTTDDGVIKEQTVRSAKAVRGEQRHFIQKNEQCRQNESRKVVRALTGKWGCTTKSSSDTWTATYKYEYDFQDDGSYTDSFTSERVSGKYVGCKIEGCGNWTLTENRLVLRPKSFSINGGLAQSYKTPVVHTYDLLWKEDGIFELRQTELVKSYKDGRQTTYNYDEQGREVSWHKGETGEFCTIQTPKVFKRVSN